MKFDYNMITSILALLSSLIAIYAIANESKRSRFALGMDLLFKINDQFDHPDFARKRKVAAMFILKLKEKSDYGNWKCAELDDVLDFFQAIASLTQKGALDKAIVWEYYSYWLFHYFEVSKEYIEFNQRVYPLSWEGVEWLNKTCLKIEQKACRRARRLYVPLSQENIKQFLIIESKLRVREQS